MNKTMLNILFILHPLSSSFIYVLVRWRICSSNCVAFCKKSPPFRRNLKARKASSRCSFPPLIAVFEFAFDGDGGGGLIARIFNEKFDEIAVATRLGRIKADFEFRRRGFLGRRAVKR